MIKKRLLYFLSICWIAGLNASLEYQIIPFDYSDENMKEQLCAMVRDDQHIAQMTHETEESMRKCLSGPDLKGNINYFVCRATGGSKIIYGYMSYGISNAAYLVQNPVSKEESLLTNSNYINDFIVLKTVIAQPFGMLDTFAVHKDYRGQGVAQAMLHYFEQECRKNGISLLLIGVEPNNDKAIRSYTKNGFKKHLEYSFIMVKNLD